VVVIPPDLVEQAVGGPAVAYEANRRHLLPHRFHRLAKEAFVVALRIATEFVGTDGPPHAEGDGPRTIAVRVSRPRSATASSVATARALPLRSDAPTPTRMRENIGLGLRL
jgi:hypothetical protein